MFTIKKKYFNNVDSMFCLKKKYKIFYEFSWKYTIFFKKKKILVRSGNRYLVIKLNYLFWGSRISQQVPNKKPFCGPYLKKKKKFGKV